MLLKFKLDLGALADGSALPRNPEPGLVCYEIVVCNDKTPILRIPFNKAGMFSMELYSDDVNINPDRVNLSNAPHVSRLPDISKPIEFHCNKIFLVNDRVRYRNHIQEDLSSNQHVPFLTWEVPTRDAADGRYVKEFALHTEGSRLTASESRGLRAQNLIYRWHTQRDFYGTSHVTKNNETHRRNIEIILQFLARAKTPTPIETLTAFGHEFTSSHGICFADDKSYGNPARDSDAGCDHLEIEGVGDCEDYAHMYMRVLRTLFAVYDFAPRVSKPVRDSLDILKDEYVPLVCICQIKTQGKLCFHSTMMLVPKSRTHPVISFEVTEPRKSYALPDADYTHWHNNVYFFLDNYFMASYNEADADVTNLTLKSLKFSNF